MTKKSKLLVRGDYPLIASPTLAQAYGVPSAMFLQKLHYCLQSSDAKCIQQQKYFYHSYEQWADTLGIYSVSTIKRIVSKLKNAGILIVKKLAQNKWLQTNFYTINYRKLSNVVKGTTQQNQAATSSPDESSTNSPIQGNRSKQRHASSTLSITAPNITKPRASNPTPIGLPSPLSPVAQASDLQAMSPEKRGLYRQLIQMKVDIHYDDARLDEWIKCKKLIVQQVAYLKDQFGHLKMHWHSPEELGLRVN
mgnify:FL=1